MRQKDKKNIKLKKQNEKKCSPKRKTVSECIFDLNTNIKLLSLFTNFYDSIASNLFYKSTRPFFWPYFEACLSL